MTASLYRAPVYNKVDIPRSPWNLGIAALSNKRQNRASTIHKRMSHVDTKHLPKSAIKDYIYQRLLVPVPRIAKNLAMGK